MSHPLLEAEGTRQLLLGNEAIVRGALEAGVSVVTCYPGTPSSEVPDTFRKIAVPTVRLEYSVNEKVAFEVAAGAALAGALCFVTMKHVGVNVAADPLFTTTYTGLPGGLVILSADDPGCHASQNEQDNRYYARFASMPCFEPSTAQELKDMTRDAFLLARELQQPVLLRTTTRVNHLRGPVTLGKLPAPAPVIPFKREPSRFVPVPNVARPRHKVLLENMAKAAAVSTASPWNKLTGKGKLGIVTSGISRNYLADAISHLPQIVNDIQILELGMTWPLPEEKIITLLKNSEKILVLEELEPLLENDIRNIAERNGITRPIIGKAGKLTRFGEYSTQLIAHELAAFAGVDAPKFTSRTPEEGLPNRPPNLCPGCSHRAIFYATRQVFGDNAIYSSDIGCYTLGLLPPLSAADFLFCMGSSISGGSGFASVSDKPVIAFIGDSTFFHSGLTGLANAVFNKHNLIVVILDNGTTAMTGHQPNPGMSQEVLKDVSRHLDIESIVRAFGITEVTKVKGYNTKATIKALEDFSQKSGVRVLITEEPCVLYARRTLKKARTQVSYVANQGAEAEKCLKDLACPAFFKKDGEVQVDENMCAGCMVCLQISPTAFKAHKRN